MNKETLIAHLKEKRKQYKAFIIEINKMLEEVTKENSDLTLQKVVPVKQEDSLEKDTIEYL